MKKIIHGLYRHKGLYIKKSTKSTAAYNDYNVIDQAACILNNPDSIQSLKTAKDFINHYFK